MGGVAKAVGLAKDKPAPAPAPAPEPAAKVAGRDEAAEEMAAMRRARRASSRALLSESRLSGEQGVTTLGASPRV